MSPKKQRILWILPSLELGGAERQAATVLPLLAEYYQPFVATLFGQGPLVKPLEEAGVRVACLEGRSLYDLSLGSKIRDVVGELKPILVHTFLWDANVLTAWALRRRPPSLLFTSRREIGAWRKKRHLWAEQWTNKLAYQVVTNSEASKHYLCDTEGINPARVSVIHNGLDLGPFQQVDPAESRRKLGTPLDSLTLGVVASLAEKKGHRFLLEALGEIRQSISPFHLFLIGDGPARGRLEKEAARLGISSSVHFLGCRQDVAALLPGLDLLIHPSTTESLPNAVLEAMAAGVTPIATDVGGVKEIIDSEKVGRLVPPNDPKALGQAIQDLSDKPKLRWEIGQAARKRVWKHFGAARAAEDFHEMYEEAIRRLHGFHADD
jgi:glycosyltransferase involved in cell wall biosynthesis